MADDEARRSGVLAAGAHAGARPRSIVYTSRLLREMLAGALDLDQPGVIGVEGAILFLDIVGSTALTDAYAAGTPHGAERLGALLDVYFSRVFDLIDLHGGDIIRLDGDSVIALWRFHAAGPVPVRCAATAAFALQRELTGWRPDGETLVRQRIVVSAGRITASTVTLSVSRQAFLVIGPPLRALGEMSLLCAPDAVLVPPVSKAAATQPSHDGSRSEPADDGAASDDPALLPFLPRMIIDRLAAGQTAWLAEFRVLTAIFVGLGSRDVDGAASWPGVRDAVAAIEAALRPLGLGIWDVADGDKGLVVTILAGLPPFAVDNNAAAAVEAARRVQGALVARGLHPAIGIASGRTFCSEVGSSRRRVHTILGPAMNHAARLMQMAGAEILCDEATGEAAARDFRFANVVPLRIKGKADALGVCRLLHRHEPMQLLPTNRGAMVGREAECAALNDCLDRAAEGTGGLVTMEAEPGGGKSRLLSYLHDRAAERGFVVLVGTANAIEQQTSYFICRALLIGLLGLPPHAGAEEAMARLSTAFEGSQYAGRIDVLADILPLGLDPRSSPQLSTASRRDGLASLIAHLLKGDAGAMAPVILLDDAHWMDQSSAHLLRLLLRAVPNLLVVMTTRPIEADGAPHVRELIATSVRHLAPARLTDDEVAELLRHTLGLAAAPLRLVRFVQVRAEGLPLYAEQLALAMREQGLIKISADGLRVDLSLDERATVATLQDVIVSRFDRLPLRQQAVLKVASVVGGRFALALLASVLDAAGEGWADLDIAALESAGLLNRDDDALSFRHIVIQQGIYDLLSLRQRAFLHRHAAEALEMDRTGLSPQFAPIADHWERAGEPKRAAQFRMRAAQSAFDAYANFEAVEQLRALDRMGGYASLLTADAERAEYARVRGVASHELSDYSDSRRWLMECARLRGLTLSRTKRQTLAEVCRAVAEQLLLRAGVRARSPARTLERDQLIAHIYMRFAEISYFEGDALGLLHATLIALNRSERAGARRELIAACGGVSIGLGVLGLDRLACFYRDRAIGLTKAADPGDRGLAHLLGAVYGLGAADWNSTLTCCATAAAIYEQLREPFRYSSCRSLTAYVHLATGDFRIAREILGSFGRQAEEVDNPTVRSWLLCGLALLDLQAGASPDSALAHLTAVPTEHLPVGETVRCLGFRAAIGLRSGDLDAAVRAAGQALALMEDHPPTATSTYHSVAAVAVTFLTVARQDPRPVPLARARRAVGILRTFARRVRIATPISAWVLGHDAQLAGSDRRAAANWRRGIAAAEALGMPLEQAMCHRELARLGTGHDNDGAHAARASEILAELDAVPWIDIAVDTPAGPPSLGSSRRTG